MLRQGIKDRNSVRQSLARIHIIMTGVPNTRRIESYAATSNATLTHDPCTYHDSGTFSCDTKPSDIAEYIIRQLETGMDKVTGRPSGSGTERWTAGREIITKIMRPSGSEMQGVAHDVSQAVTKENRCQAKTKVLSADGSISTIKKGSHPFKWDVTVTTGPSNTIGDLVAGYCITKGYTGQGSGLPEKIQPSIHAIVVWEHSTMVEKYGWENLWTKDGKMKSTEQLEGEKKYNEAIEEANQSRIESEQSVGSEEESDYYSDDSS